MALPFNTLLLVLATLDFHHIHSDDFRKNITLFSISNILEDGSGDGTSITGGEWIAMMEVNNNTNLLPDYKLDLKGNYKLHIHIV